MDIVITLAFEHIIHNNFVDTFIHHKFHNARFMSRICILALWFQNWHPQEQNHIVVTTALQMWYKVQFMLMPRKGEAQPLYYAVGLSLAPGVNTL